MTDQESWGESRWEFTKNRSRWHFDTKKPPETGVDSYTHVCRFEGNFSDAIAEILPLTTPRNWSTRKNQINTDKKEQIYSAKQEEFDLIKAGADPKKEIFHRAPANDIPIFSKIGDWLGMDKTIINFHNQTTGQLMHTHIDVFSNRPERNNSFEVSDMDLHPETMRTFIVMLADWQLGQIFQIGNANFTQWRAGDCITWEWFDMPHSTANMGWWDRPMLQITGYVTDKTRDVMGGAGKNLLVVL